MKIYTIELCGQCPSYVDGTYICLRNKAIRVYQDQQPPDDCPLKNYIERNEKHEETDDHRRDK